MLFLQALAVALCVFPLVTTYQPSSTSYLEKQFSQNFYDGYNILKHVGGIGPYSDRVSYGIDRNTPAGCAVDQVLMLMRHAERYPDTTTAATIQASLQKLYSSGVKTWLGDLAFLNNWSNYLSDLGMLQQETYSGPYGGLLHSFKRGSEYRERYGHLWDKQSIVPIFAGGYERVVETARYFGMGFFNYNYSTSAAINIISENYTQGADTLTPTCLADTSLFNCFYASRTFPIFNVTAARFNAQNPGLSLNSSDIIALMETATFELQTRSYSPWVNAFTLDEWVAFGYVQDLTYYYCSGPGRVSSLAVGQVLANASLTVLETGPSMGTMFWNFAHDSYVAPMVAALGLDIPANPLPNNSIPFPNPYNSADIVPMGGHITLERLTCNATAMSPAGTYVRAVINEAVVPWNSCQTGPGYSCPLSNVSAIVAKAPNFVQLCGVKQAGYPEYIDFWWNYNKTTTLNYQNGSIGYQATYTLI